MSSSFMVQIVAQSPKDRSPLVINCNPNDLTKPCDVDSLTGVYRGKPFKVDRIDAEVFKGVLQESSNDSMIMSLLLSKDVTKGSPVILDFREEFENEDSWDRYHVSEVETI